MEALFDNSHKHVNGNCDPYLGFHGVFGCAVESLYPQMLLDPPEEKFHLPAATIEIGNRQGRKAEVVCKKYQTVFGGGIEIMYASQPFGIAFLLIKVFQRDGLIAFHAAGPVDGRGKKPFVFESLFGPCDEEGTGLMNVVQPGEIQVSTVHQVNGSGFPVDLIEDVDLVSFAIGNDDNGGNAAAKVE